MRLAVLLLILMRSISFWAAFLSFVSIRINNADAFVVTVTTKPLLLLSSWGSRQRKTTYRCWYSKVDDDDETTAEQTQEASSPARQTKYDKKWLDQYENLKEYNNKHGYCNVPQSEGSLGKWVNAQRHMFKQEKMREDRQKLLDESEFV
jgi:hypothetical protein